jgi:hypothetical protein
MRLKSFNLLKERHPKLVEVIVETERLLPVAAGWDNRLGSTLMQLVAQLGGIAGLVTEHVFRRLRSADKPLRDRAVVCFTSGQQDGDEAPFSRECVNHRVAPASRAANSLVLLPAFSARRRAVRFDVGGVVSPDRPLQASPEQVFPTAASRPAHEAVIDRRPLTIRLRAIAPTTAALEPWRFSVQLLLKEGNCLTTGSFRLFRRSIAIVVDLEGSGLPGHREDLEHISTAIPCLYCDPKFLIAAIHAVSHLSYSQNARPCMMCTKVG